MRNSYYWQRDDFKEWFSWYWPGLLVLLIGAALIGLIILGACASIEYRDGLMQACMADGNPEYHCYGLINGGRN